MRFAPWSDTRKIRIDQLWEALAEEALTGGSYNLSSHRARGIARAILGHPSTRTMLDYFADLEDCDRVGYDDPIGTTRILALPPRLLERQRERDEIKENSS